MSAVIKFAPNLNRQILQRDPITNQAMLEISGSVNGLVDQVEIQLLPRAGYAGTATDLIRLPLTLGQFQHSIVMPAGYYDLIVTAYEGFYPRGEKTSIPTGIGDVFLTGGQSNATNSLGPTPTTPTHDGVQCWNANGTWQLAADPQPGVGDNSQMASLWPTIGDLLVAHNGIPVGFVCSGYGGTEIVSWTPATNTLWPQLLEPMFTRCGANARSMIWDQGEADASDGTTQPNYFSRITAVIDASRVIVPGLPWGIASATWNSSLPAGSAAVRAAQAQAQAYTACFVGADTDTLDNTYRRDGAHFNNATGIPAAAALWANALIAGLGL